MSNQPWKISAPTRHKAYTNRDLRGKDWCVSGVRLDMFDTVHVMCQSRARCVILIHPDTVGQNICSVFYESGDILCMFSSNLIIFVI